MNWPLIALTLGTAMAFNTVLLIFLLRDVAVLRMQADAIEAAIRARNDALVSVIHDRRHSRASVENVPGYKHKVARINWPSSDRPPEA